MRTLIRIVNDIIYSVGESYDHQSPREQNTREAMLVITVLAPLLGAFLSLCIVPVHKTHHRPWMTYHRLLTAWFISVAAFGALVYYQAGHTSRVTFVLAVFHNMIEVLFVCMFLRLRVLHAFYLSVLYGALVFPIVLLADSMSTVFISAAVFGGAIDFLLVLLLMYARQWSLAFGAAGHVLSAVAVFANTLDDFGVLPYTAAIFVGVWSHMAFTMGGILELRDKHGHTSELQSPQTMFFPTPKHEARVGKLGSRHLHAPASLKAHPPPTPHHHHGEHECGERYLGNPLAHTYIPRGRLFAILAASLVGSTALTLFLALRLPALGVCPWGHAQ